MTKFDVKDSRLNVIQKGCLSMVVEFSSLPILPVVAEPADEARNLFLVGSYGPTVAEPAQEFERVETETTRQSERPRPLAPKFCPQGLGRVLDDYEVVYIGDIDDPIHLADSAVQGNGNDGFCARCDDRLDRIRVHIIIVANFHQDRLCTNIDDGRYGSNKGVRHCDYFIARSNAGSLQGKLKRMIAAVQPHCVLDANERSEVSLEIPQLLPENQISLREAVANRTVDFRLKLLILSFRIYERHFKGHWTLLPIPASAAGVPARRAKAIGMLLPIRSSRQVS